MYFAYDGGWWGGVGRVGNCLGNAKECLGIAIT